MKVGDLVSLDSNFMCGIVLRKSEGDYWYVFWQHGAIFGMPERFMKVIQ